MGGQAQTCRALQEVGRQAGRAAAGCAGDAATCGDSEDARHLPALQAAYNGGLLNSQVRQRLVNGLHGLRSRIREALDPGAAAVALQQTFKVRGAAGSKTAVAGQGTCHHRRALHHHDMQACAGPCTCHLVLWPAHAAMRLTRPLRLRRPPLPPAACGATVPAAV